MMIARGGALHAAMTGAPEKQSMVRFFTVKWPRLARLEACVLFVAIVWMCGNLAMVRSIWISSLAVIADDVGQPEKVFFWTLLSMILAGPYLCVMMMVDRLLAVRKGFAVLSILAVLTWAAVAAALSSEWGGTADFALKAAIGSGVVSLLFHGGALRTGLTDRGFVGLRLAKEPYRPGGRGSIFGDKTQSEPWFAPNPRSRNEQEPHRGNGALLLGMLAWGCIFTTAIGGYVLYHGNSETVPYSQANPTPLPRSPENPPPLPRVITSGTDTATSQRYNGHFVFAARVNGHPVSMLFDTGASMVTLRAEDADRLGIPVSRLTFSMRVATANGIGLVAVTTIDTLTVGSVTQRNVLAFVASPGTLRENLLGQSFLNKLQSYKVENNHVILKSY